MLNLLKALLSNSSSMYTVAERVLRMDPLNAENSKQLDLYYRAALVISDIVHEIYWLILRCVFTHHPSDGGSSFDEDVNSYGGGWAYYLSLSALARTEDRAEEVFGSGPLLDGGIDWDPGTLYTGAQPQLSALLPPFDMRSRSMSDGQGPSNEWRLQISTSRVE